MLSAFVSNGSLLCSRINSPKKEPCLCYSKPTVYYCQQKNTGAENALQKFWERPKPRVLNSVVVTPEQDPSHFTDKKEIFEEKNGGWQKKGGRQTAVLCGLGYWVNGFRCFPWLGLNFHMANNLSMHPSILQMVQNSGNLPMVAKPLYGILSDTLYINGAHRIPYIAIGVLLQAVAWGSLALIPVASEALPVLMFCVLLSNLGASTAEVAEDALIAEYGQRNKIPGLQSYGFMASAAGGILGNLFGGYFLLKTRHTKYMFLAFAAFLALQLAMTLTTREESLGLSKPPPNQSQGRNSILKGIRTQYSDLMAAVKEEKISGPLIWVVASIMIVPVLSGSIFCYQTQCLNLDPLVIGMSKVTGQLMLLSMTLLYDRTWKNIPMRKVIGTVQVLYSSSLLLDLVLVKQLNLRLGIPNEAFALCFSGIAETIAQFKLLPFCVLFASLAPPGCEGSLMSFLASALCLSSIVSGFLGVGLSSVLSITCGDYSNLPLGIVIQSLAALLPVLWMNRVPVAQPPSSGKERKKGRSRRTRRIRRIGRVVLYSIYSYRRQREADLQR